MTRKAQTARQGKASAGAHKAVPWAALGLVIVGMALLATKSLGPVERLANRMLDQITGSSSLTIIHTNDTYGYIFPCG